MSVSRPVAPADKITNSWWDGTRDRTLLIQECVACGHHQHYPRSLCTNCGSVDLRDVRANGTGAVYSFTVVHRAPHPAFTPPYVVALVRLDEGPVMMSNIVGCRPDEVRCDMRVSVTWEDLPDGRRLPMFAPAGG